MEQKTTNSTEALTEDQLRNAGASSAYIAYYLTAQEMGVETSSTRHAERIVRQGVNYSGDAFHESLWNDDARWSGDNPYGASHLHQMMLNQAKVYPYY
jgi:hypothetical protein